MGKKTLLFGCHQFLIHGLFTLLGWMRLYGIRSLNTQYVIACFIHDLGYWRMQTMDGDGLFHPISKVPISRRHEKMWHEIWFHSRHLCQILRAKPSRLCWADKLGTALMPSWLWGTLAHWSGEGYEYMANVHGHDYVRPEEFTRRGLIRFHQKYKLIWGNLDYLRSLSN